MRGLWHSWRANLYLAKRHTPISSQAIFFRIVCHFVIAGPNINWTTTVDVAKLLNVTQDLDQGLGYPNASGLRFQHWNQLNPEHQSDPHQNNVQREGP